MNPYDRSNTYTMSNPRNRESGQSDLSALFEIFIVLAIIAGAAYAVYWAGSTESSAANENCVVYSGGSLEDKTFQEILPAGKTRASIGWGSKTYCYRIDQRSYVGGEGYKAENAGTAGNPDAPAVEFVGGPSEEGAESSVRMRAPYQLYFTLNQQDALLRQFHQRLGVKTKAWTSDGWRELLKTYFEPQIERAMEAAALQFPWNDLYSDGEARDQFEAETVKLLKAAMEDVIGGNYFCSPSYTGGKSKCGDFTFTVGKPQIVGEGIVARIEGREEAVRDADNQEIRNERARTALDVDRELVELYGPEGALLYKAIESGKVTNFIIAPNGDIVPAVPTGG